MRHIQRHIRVAVAVAIFGGTTATTAHAQRTTVPFQYAWRFHYGDDPSSPPE
eukprot:gene6668-7892_t